MKWQATLIGRSLRDRILSNPRIDRQIDSLAAQVATEAQFSEELYDWIVEERALNASLLERIEALHDEMVAMRSGWQSADHA